MARRYGKDIVRFRPFITTCSLDGDGGGVDAKDRNSKERADKAAEIKGRQIAVYEDLGRVSSEISLANIAVMTVEEGTSEHAAALAEVEGLKGREAGLLSQEAALNGELRLLGSIQAEAQTRKPPEYDWGKARDTNRHKNRNRFNNYEPRGYDYAAITAMIEARQTAEYEKAVGGKSSDELLAELREGREDIGGDGGGVADGEWGGQSVEAWEKDIAALSGDGAEGGNEREAAGKDIKPGEKSGAVKGPSGKDDR